MLFTVGFLIVCVILAIAMEHAPSWVYGAFYVIMDKIMG